MAKQSLKEQFLDKFADSDGDGTKIINYTDANQIFEFFEPYLKKQSKPKIVLDIPLDKIKEFNELWPAIKLKTGQYARCSERELISSFTAFFKEFPTYNDWDILLRSASAYLAEREAENWEYTRRSKYFIRRENKDKSNEFLIHEYYERIRDGVNEESSEGQSYFEPRVFK